MAITRLLARPYLLGLLTAGAALIAATGWLLASNGGLRWVSGVVQSHSGGALEISGAEGALLNDFGAERVVLRGESWRVEIAQLRVHWQPMHLLQGELKILQLSARQVDVLSLPDAAAFALPATLRPPLEIDLPQFQVDTFRLFSRENAAPDFIAQALRGRYRADKRTHQLQDLQARFAAGEMNGSAQISQDAPYHVQAIFRLHGELGLADNTFGLNALAELNGDLQRMELNLAATGEGAQLHAELQLLPAAASPLAHTRIGFSGVNLQRLEPDAPATDLSGELDLNGSVPGVLEGSVQISNARPAALDRGGLPLTRARAQLAWEQRKVQLRELELQLLHGGLVLGEADWQLQPQRGKARWQVRSLDPAAIDGRAPSLDLQGEIALEANAVTQQAVLSLHNAAWKFSGTLQKQGVQLDLSRLRVEHGSAVLTGSGRMKLAAQRPFHLDTRLQHLDLAEFSGAPPTAINAGLVLDGTLLPEPAGLLDFVFFDSRFGGHVFDGDGRLRVLPGMRAMGDMNVRLGDNTLNLNVAYGTANDYLRLTLDAPQLVQLGNGLSGQLAGEMEWRGSLAEPEAGFSLRGSQLKLPSGVSMEELGAGGVLDAQAIALHLNASDVRDSGALALPQVQLDLEGSAARHTLRAAARLTRFEQALGDLNLTANGSWARTEQAWRWQGAVDTLNTHGVLPLQLQAAAPLVVAPEEISLGVAKFGVAGGYLELNDTRWSPQGWHTAGSFGGIGVRAVGVVAAPELFDTLRFGGAWHVSAAPDWRARIDLHRESGDWVVDANTRQGLGLRDLRLNLGAEHGLLDVQLNASGERLGEVSAQANMPYHLTAGVPGVAPDAPLHGRLQLHSADLAWLGPLLDGNLQSGGSLHLDAELQGTRDMPRLLGEAHGADLRVALLDQGISLEQGTLALRFAPDAIHIDRLDFVAPYLARPQDPLLSEYRLPRSSGRMSVAGSMSLTGDAAQLDVLAEGLPLAQRPDRWLIVSGKAQARYASKTLRMNGDIRADAGLISQITSNRPRWADDVMLVGQKVEKNSGFGRIAAFNLDLGDDFYLRALGLESRLSGKLAVYGEANEALQASGSIATELGILDVYGQRLQVERGRVNFQGPLDDPGLNILALRKGLSVEAGVAVTGTARHPVTRLVSTPEVPDAEKLSWIVLGRVPESGGFDASLLLAAAGNVVGGSSAGQIGRAIGVDELSLHQKEEGDVLQSQVVTVGKRLSSRAYLSYEQGVADPGGIAKFTYNLTPRITIVTRTGIEDAVDLFYSFRFY
ncbi:MAG: translocation/assembly module TamB domain-containing protein [Sideroxydans sp.]